MSEDMTLNLNEADLGNSITLWQEANKEFEEAAKEKIDFLEREAYEWIGRLKEVGQEIKDRLKKLYNFTIIISQKAKPYILYVGKIIIKGLKKFIELFPTLSTGVAIGIFLSFLISSIPFVGGFISSIFSGIAIPAFGILGAVKDFPGFIDALAPENTAEGIKKFFGISAANA